MRKKDDNGANVAKVHTYMYRNVIMVQAHYIHVQKHNHGSSTYHTCIETSSWSKYVTYMYRNVIMVKVHYMYRNIIMVFFFILFYSINMHYKKKK